METRALGGGSRRVIHPQTKALRRNPLRSRRRRRRMAHAVPPHRFSELLVNLADFNP